MNHEWVYRGVRVCEIDRKEVLCGGNIYKVGC